MTRLSFIVLLFVAHTVCAQDYPNRPVRLLVGLGAGGGSDTVARIMTTKLSEMLGQSFVVDNRPSAGGAISSQIVAKAAPDGYTLLAMSPTHVVTPNLRSDAGYDPIRDFAPIVLTVFTPYVLSVRNSVAAANVKELIVLAKKERLTYASSGIGGSNHLTGELFKHMAGVNLVHVPYKSGAQANSALIAGEVHVSFTAIGGLVPHIKAGRVRALGVTSAKRSAATPDIPTIAESGCARLRSHRLVWFGHHRKNTATHHRQAQHHSQSRTAGIERTLCQHRHRSRRRQRC